MTNTNPVLITIDGDGKSKPKPDHIPTVVWEGYKFVDSIEDRADDFKGGFAPLWHGWAIREAFEAGAKWQKEHPEK